MLTSSTTPGATTPGSSRRRWRRLLPSGVLVLVTAALGSVPVAGADEAEGRNGGPGAAQADRQSAATPRSPGVRGVRTPGALGRTCAVYSFADQEQFSAPTTFPGGTFAGSGTVVVVGVSWGTWRPQTDGLHLLFADRGRYVIRFAAPVRGVVLKAEPNDFGAWPITVSAFDPAGRPLGSFTRTIVGDAGASFLGLVSQSRPIRRVVVTAPAEAQGFAFSNLTWGPNSCHRG